MTTVPIPEASKHASFDSTTRLHNTLQEHGLQLRASEDGSLVDWNAQARDYPKNWSWRPTIYNLIVVLLWSMFTTILTTIGTSASSKAREEFDISQQVGFLIFTTSTLIGEGLGGILVAPLSESFGRKTVYLLGSVLATISCGISAIPHPAGVTIGRFLTGIACAIPPSISGGIIKDVFHDSVNLDWAVFIWTTISNAGLSIGPIVSAYLVFNAGWQWPFYLSMIIAFVLTIFSIGMEESRASRLLSKKVDQVEQATESSNLPTKNSDAFPSWSEFIRKALLRPLRLLFTEPIVAVSAIIAATIFGLAYGLTAGLEIVYTDFGFSKSDASLSFIPIFLGLWLSVLPRLYDHWNRRIARKEGKKLDSSPEAKLWSFAYPVPIFAIGLWLFAWTIRPKVSVH